MSMLRLTILLTLGLQGVGCGQTFNGQVFEVAEDFVTDQCEVFAECDCCTTDIFFLSTDKFCFVSRCISGDSYFTGTYSIKSGKLKLTFDKKYVEEIADEDDNVIKLETKIKNTNPIEFDIAKCGEKVRLTHPITREWRNGGRYGTKRESEMMKQLKMSRVFKQLSE